MIDISFTDKGFDLEVDRSDSSSVVGKVGTVLLCPRYAGLPALEAMVALQRN